MSCPETLDGRPLRVDYESREDFLDDYRLNLDRGRVTVRSDRQLEVGQLLQIAISFPGLRKKLCLQARVVSMSEGGAEEASYYELDLNEMSNLQQQAFGATVARIAKRDPELVTPRRMRILVVEDNRHVAELIQRGLEGHLQRTRRALAVEVELAEDGVEALRRVAETHYGLLLVDICLPVMGGDELISTLRREERHHNLPIIALSAAGDVREVAMRAGANAFMHKPIRLKELLETISTLVPTLDL